MDHMLVLDGVPAAGLCMTLSEPLNLIELSVLYPPDENPKFGVIRPNMKLTTWKLLDVYNGNVLTQGKVGADISWWRYTFTCSLHLMENETADKYNTEKTEDWYSKLNNTLINKLNK